MPIETTLIKRRALYVGEIGFFASTPMAEEDIAIAKMDGEVICSFWSPLNLQALKFLWALVHKVAENSDRWLDKDEAMVDLKFRARFVRFVRNAKNQMELRVKSLKRISDEELRSLTNKIINIVCTEIWPELKPDKLRTEIEKMVGPR